MQKRNSVKQQPGCMGRMVKLFDMDDDTAGNKLLMDRPYIDGKLFCSNFQFQTLCNSCYSFSNERSIIKYFTKLPFSHLW